MLAPVATPWVKRAPTNPILDVTSHPSLADGVSNPSLVRLPGWMDAAHADAGSYRLYVAGGPLCSLAVAASAAPEGPWQLIADVAWSDRPEITGAPDAVVDWDDRVLRLYVAQPVAGTIVGASDDGVRCSTVAEIAGPPLLRVFRTPEAWWAIDGTGVLVRSDDGLTGWERGPRLLSEAVRGVAVLADEPLLRILFTEIGDCPEQVLHTTVATTGPWTSWTAGPTTTVLGPTESWEGAGLPLVPSKTGPAGEPVRQLRDPAVYVEGAQRWLLYAAGGEQAIGIARFL